MNTQTRPSGVKLVLASSSPYRKQQLEERLQLTLTCLAPNIEENRRKHESPREMSLRLAENKARAVLSKLNSPTIVIAGDQTAELNGNLLRKPGDRTGAIEQLRQFSGRTILFYSGVCVLDSTSGDCRLRTVLTKVRFRQLSQTQITGYVDRDRPFDCLGAFKNERLGIALFESLESDDPSALTGLPLIALCGMLADLGMDVLDG